MSAIFMALVTQGFPYLQAKQAVSDVLSGFGFRETRTLEDLRQNISEKTFHQIEKVWCHVAIRRVQSSYGYIRTHFPCIIWKVRSLNQKFNCHRNFDIRVCAARSFSLQIRQKPCRYNPWDRPLCDTYICHALAASVEVQIVYPLNEFWMWHFRINIHQDKCGLFPEF